MWKYESLAVMQRILAVGSMAVLNAAPLQAQRQMESLTRGTVAVRHPDGQVYVGWRWLGTESDTLAFNVYRRGHDGVTSRVNDTPLLGATNLVDRSPEAATAAGYLVRPLLEGRELQSDEIASVWDQPYLEIPIDPIEGYRPGDASVGDLDGDGDYEIVLHQVSRGRDNSHSGLTGKPILDAYEMDGRRLWRIDLGINIREGEHYKQFMVYTTTLLTEHRLRTLMHDPQYRLSIAWQNVVYNKPPHPGFYLGHGMQPPSPPKITLVDRLKRASPTED